MPFWQEPHGAKILKLRKMKKQKSTLPKLSMMYNPNMSTATPLFPPNTKNTLCAPNPTLMVVVTPAILYAEYPVVNEFHILPRLTECRKRKE